MSDFTKPVLALDCALGGCTASVLKDGAAYSRTIETDREQAAKLMPMAQDLVREAGIEFAGLGLIVTTIGPGSFTGLRIGLSAARALGLALSVPVQGVTTFEAMVLSAVPEHKSAMVILETKRTDFYVQAFDADKMPLHEPACMEEAELRGKIAGGDFILCGDGLARLGVEGRVRRLIDPETLARAGIRHFTANGLKAEKPEPLYLRGADVSLSNKKQREIGNLPVKQQ